MKQPCVYILTNQARGTLYIGVTSNLIQRVWQHKQDLVEGFTKQHQLHHLAYYEIHEDMLTAITREKQLKKWNRAWKIELIEATNSDWQDLYLCLISN
jgi:putative endonuclease